MKPYILIFKKYRKIIILVTIITTILTFLVNFFYLPKIYRGTAILSPPIIVNIISDKSIEEKYLYDFDSLYTKVSDESFLISLIEKNPELNLSFQEFKNNIKFESIGRTSYIKITYEDKQKDRILKIFEIILNQLKNVDYNFLNYIDYSKKRLEELNNDIEKIEDYKKSIEDKINKIKGNKLESTLDYTFLLSTLNSVNELWLEKKYEVGLYQRVVEESKNYHYLNEPQVQDKPVKPRKLLNTIFAFFASIFITFLLFIFYEYLKGELNV